MAAAILVAIGMFLGLDRAAAAVQLCSPQQMRDGGCNESVGGSIEGGTVVLTGQGSSPGQPGGGANPGFGTGTGTSTGPMIFAPPGSPVSRLICLATNPTRPELCPPAPPPADPGIPPITIQDVATFIPTPGRQQMEPDGWTVAGLDTNFYAITGPHVVNGTLLGRPADVRFTPTTYLWAYGDGSAATKSTPGATWSAQGIPEFEPTPTSHVYEQLGDYTITLDVVFAAEYRFAGGPWRAVIGTITLPANDLYIRAGTAKTVLVEHDCLANPTGPGC